jgi:hypothetical protein
MAFSLKHLNRQRRDDRWSVEGMTDYGRLRRTANSFKGADIQDCKSKWQNTSFQGVSVNVKVKLVVWVSSFKLSVRLCIVNRPSPSSSWQARMGVLLVGQGRTGLVQWWWIRLLWDVKWKPASLVAGGEWRELSTRECTILPDAEIKEICENWQILTWDTTWALWDAAWRI